MDDPEALETKAKVGCLKRKKKVEATRTIHVNQAFKHKVFKGNQTSTTKYNIFTYFPKALFEQYRRVANIYFTIVAALSLTPYSPVRAWTTYLPLIIVLGVSMVKEAIEDFKRYKQDTEVNNRKVDVFNPHTKEFETRTWKDVQPGDIVAVYKDQFFPADLLLLTAENEEGICYIETMNLDGETNLKIKKCLDETKNYDRDTVGKFTADIECEGPNSRLYTFTGNLHLEGSTIPLGPASILLRGCSLRNTERVYGAVIYAGHETKVFKNATKAPSKRSTIERTVDKIIFVMFGMLFAMCIVGCAYFSWWTKNRMPLNWYLFPGNAPTQYSPDNPGGVAGTNFITSFILYGYLIPISLYVSIEMVKVVQSMVFINRDKAMYHTETDTPAQARTSNLNEELGMVNTILSDKTGTLTRNVMEFFKCSIAGVSYGQGVTEVEKSNASRRGERLSDGGQLPAAQAHREQFFNFYDDRIMDGRWFNQPNADVIEQFFRMLAVCHTVIPDGPADPHSLKYEAESPDEAALVVAAKKFGFFFHKRTSTTVTVREDLPGGTRVVDYELLNILEFNSTRKRMSVIIRDPDGKLLLYCKGADTVIYERLDPEYELNAEMKSVTSTHMEEYGSAGLRTLCLAWTELDPEEYDEWQQKFVEAKCALENREEKVMAANELIEKNLRLLGCTAIEDKLQDGVPDAIATLANANIRLWVLTGDKMETAVNIGYACSLLHDSMTQFRVSGSMPEVEKLEAAGKLGEAHRVAAAKVEQQLQEVENMMNTAGEAQYALIIDGKGLAACLTKRMAPLFLRVGLRCSAVVCCRVSPLQKAQVTQLVRSHGDTTLAIGDGANDVGMIQKAHIGVGISGQEGMQAAMASDFSIAQFKYLVPLLLVHGRWSYKRIARMVNFFFYKNLIFGVSIFAYNAFTLFSGQIIFNDFYMTLYNVVFTSVSPIIIGIFDRDVSRELALKYPGLYKQSQRNTCFNLSSICGWLGNALLQVAILMTMVMVGCLPTAANRLSGQTFTHFETGIYMFTVIVVLVHLQLALVLEQWTWLHHVSIWGSIIVWFLYIICYSYFPLYFSLELYQIFNGIVANTGTFWLMMCVVPITCLLPAFFVRQVMAYQRPPDHQIVAEHEKALLRPGTAAFDPEEYRAHKARKMLRKKTKSQNRGFVPPMVAGQRSFYQGTRVEINPDDGDLPDGYGNGAAMELQRDSVRNPVLSAMDAHLEQRPMRHRESSKLGCFHIPKVRSMSPPSQWFGRSRGGSPVPPDSARQGGSSSGARTRNATPTPPDNEV